MAVLSRIFLIRGRRSTGDRPFHALITQCATAYTAAARRVGIVRGVGNQPARPRGNYSPRQLVPFPRAVPALRTYTFRRSRTGAVILPEHPSAAQPVGEIIPPAS